MTCPGQTPSGEADVLNGVLEGDLDDDPHRRAPNTCQGRLFHSFLPEYPVLTPVRTLSERGTLTALGSCGFCSPPPPTASFPRPMKPKSVRPTPAVKQSVKSATVLPHGFQSLGTHCIRKLYRLPPQQPASSPPIPGPLKVLALDMDDTVIKTVSGGKFARSPTDWQWWAPQVPAKLQQWAARSPRHVVALFSNQGGVTNSPTGPPSKSLANLVQRLHLLLSSPELAALPIAVYAATKNSAQGKRSGLGSSDSVHSHFRKPGPGMFAQLVDDCGPVALDESLFVGDAAGRPTDFSDSDKKFAQAVGLKFLTPEQFFCDKM